MNSCDEVDLFDSVRKDAGNLRTVVDDLAESMGQNKVW